MNGTYSFLNTGCTVAGPGGVAQVGAGSGSAEEGITIEAAEDKNVMTTGADGSIQHSLIAADTAKATIRLLKTSPVNAILGAMYDLQSSSSALWGQNVITLSNSGLGDVTVGQSCAFKKKPTLTYAKEGGIQEWEFDVGSATTIFGV